VIGSVGPTETRSPRRGPENYHGKQKKNTCNLKPQNSADACEWAHKTAHAFAQVACGLSGNLARSAAARRGRLRGRRVAGGWRGSGSDALACGASNNAEPDAQSAPDGLRLHFDLMVTARAEFGFSANCLNAGCSDRALEVR